MAASSAELGQEIARVTSALKQRLQLRHHTPGYLSSQTEFSSISSEEHVLEDVHAEYGSAKGLEVRWSQDGRRFHVKETGKKNDKAGLVVVEEDVFGNESLYGLNTTIGPDSYNVEPGYSHPDARALTATSQQEQAVLQGLGVISSAV